MTTQTPTPVTSTPAGVGRRLAEGAVVAAGTLGLAGMAGFLWLLWWA